MGGWVRGGGWGGLVGGGDWGGGWGRWASGGGRSARRWRRLQAMEFAEGAVEGAFGFSLQLREAIDVTVASLVVPIRLAELVDSGGVTFVDFAYVEVVDACFQNARAAQAPGGYDELFDEVGPHRIAGGVVRHELRGMTAEFGRGLGVDQDFGG